MSGDARDWAEQYASLAQDYLASREEAALKRAYEMGRRAVEQGLGVLDVAEAHSRVLISALGRGPTAGEGAQLAETAAEFLVESLAPFEMTHRGFKEVNGELHKLNRILEDRAVELEAANKELEAFSYSVSHDLRAPLRHISGYANMLAEYAEGILDEKGRRFLRVIVDAAKGMETLIAELLNFSRMARAEMRAAQVSLEPIVRDIIGEMSPDMVGRDVEWLIGELPEV
ncbi:MAG: hypothetical protein HYU64_14125, partial [Armatimonadetes bacterium]|nr:hypothetical protein [Armatimonadota bacterium]